MTIEVPSLPDIDLDQAAALLGPLTDLVIAAGAAILAVDRAAMKVAGKPDGSPVTEADMAADRIIAAGLARLMPQVPTLSEERAQRATPEFGGTFFLIDPLDGTKEFVAGRNEFTVNIALIVKGTPLLGVIGAPALGLIWRGMVGRGAERVAMESDSSLRTTAIHARATPAHGEPWIAAVSRSHGNTATEAFIAARPGAVRLEMGSAIKFCRVAEGAADIYPRLAPTCEWDVAAGQALLVAAGGLVTDGEGAAIRFGGARKGYIVPDFIAWGDPAVARGV
ncbi:3'(2'),5'-bisphosphate nucleotidase CysQ [soil metagenome]